MTLITYPINEPKKIPASWSHGNLSLNTVPNSEPELIDIEKKISNLPDMIYSMLSNCFPSENLFKNACEDNIITELDLESLNKYFNITEQITPPTATKKLSTSSSSDEDQIDLYINIFIEKLYDFHKHNKISNALDLIFEYLENVLLEKQFPLFDKIIERMDLKMLSLDLLLGLITVSWPWRKYLLTRNKIYSFAEDKAKEKYGTADILLNQK